jgi:hypothetical protein
LSESVCKSDEDESLEMELKLLVLDSYNSLIRERYERKRFIREFGLLNELNNNQAVLFNDKLAYLNLQQNNFKCGEISHYKRLTEKDLLIKMSLPIKFQRVFANIDAYLKYAELTNHQVNLSKRIEALKEYRKMGLTHMRHVNTYKTVKAKRLNRTLSVFMSSLVTSLNRCSASVDKADMYAEQFREWFKQLIISEKISSEKKPGFNATYQAVCKNNPLKIENYPDFEKLNEEEKEFCRVARIQPAVLLRVKSILILEYNKTGHCSYSRARKIAGIDVNKTRLIHNLMINSNLIKATSEPQDSK